MDKRVIGKYGERLACEFLKKKGYKIIDNNYRTRVGEIDIIARDRESLVFIEVKTRTDIEAGYPEQNITSAKLQNFKAASQIYILDNNITLPFHLDVISVDLSKSRPDIVHFKNITL